MARMRLDLNVDAPEQVPDVLRDAADAYDEFQGEWQEPGEGTIWTDIAKILDKAAHDIDTKLKRYGY